MQAVYEAGNLIDAYLVRHALEEAGIPVYIRGEALVGGIGELPVYGLIGVCVPPGAWQEAREVIAELPLLSGGMDAPDADDQACGHSLPDCPQAS